LSLNSRASYTPVDAPLGTAALKTYPSVKMTSASTVGLPLESSISLARTEAIVENCLLETAADLDIFESIFMVYFLFFLFNYGKSYVIVLLF
jgi:hypothetical protein